MLRATIIGIFLSTLVAQMQAQKLQPGDLAPAFLREDIYGDSVRVEADNPTKIWLGFMRYAGCPVCNFRANELQQNITQINAAGYQLILIYESETETLRQYMQDVDNIPYTIIADPKRELFKKFGVEPSFIKTLGSAFNGKVLSNRKNGSQLFDGNKQKRDGKIAGIPADFLIDRNGKITTAYYGVNIGDHLPLNVIINQK